MSNSIFRICCQNSRFVDVSNETALINKVWDDSSPKWRLIGKGFSVEGFCGNGGCEAYQELVCITLGYRSFKLVDGGLGEIIHCPVCDGNVNPINLSFNNCCYQILGKKADLTLYSKPTTRVGNYYSTFDLSKAGTTSWPELSIDVRPFDGVIDTNSILEECCICYDTLMGGNQVAITDCGHYFHVVCLNKWKFSCNEKRDQFCCPMDRNPIENFKIQGTQAVVE